MTDFRYPGPPTAKVLKHVNDKITELEWNDGPKDLIESLYKERAVLEQMMKAGELYVPNF